MINDSQLCFAKDHAFCTPFLVIDPETLLQLSFQINIYTLKNIHTWLALSFPWKQTMADSFGQALCKYLFH